MHIAIICALVVAAGLSSAAAQSPAPPPAPAPSAPAAPKPGMAGSRVILSIDAQLSSKTSARGDFFAIKLAEPIVVDGVVRVPAGVPGQGQVVDAGKSGIGGKPGKLVLAARYLDYEGRRIPLRAFKLGVVGDDRTTEVMVVSMIPIAGIAGVFVHGGEIEVSPGARAVAKLAEDLPPA